MYIEIGIWQESNDDEIERCLFDVNVIR